MKPKASFLRAREWSPVETDSHSQALNSELPLDQNLMVDPKGLEPLASTLQMWRSSQLS